MNFLQQFVDARRTFQYDYIYIDAFFLLIWIIILLRNKKHSALIFGAIIAPIIYFIDAVIWWNKSAGPEFSAGTFIREYWIGGIQISHHLGNFFWLKFGADFMMTISYSLFSFSWIWIMFENIRKKPIGWKEIWKFSTIYFSFWILIPLLSILLPINNMVVEAVRHMQAQIPFMIADVVGGYLILLIVYRKELATVGKVFLIGVAASLIMEIPLYLFQIRPIGIKFLFFEALFLLNQGVPYLFLVYDKLLMKNKQHNGQRK
ncbi:MAG: hypothetical protein NTW79_01920 [Candidatus Berkelbacteria bacterium]|nr:hypothetical protein [Candidatus Berkelbacteria bacterium]